MSLNPSVFFATIRASLFGNVLNQHHVDGMNAILAAWDKSGFSDDRWLAYCLGTAFHETARTMWPIKEYGLGRGHPYGRPGKHAGQIAFGRGFVQLTWDANYERADRDLKLGGALLKNFDLALDPDIAAEVLIRGCAEAWFTRFRLSDYFNDHQADFVHARRIVNGMDKAQAIAGYALAFHAALAAAARPAQVAQVSAPAIDPDDIHAEALA